MTAEARAEALDVARHVVATAGHVDHGKSALIRAMTGIEPDRLAEERRRGLTIDLGYAWCELPSGREVGFVDVPGHERFVRNMLAGVGPVRVILFVVAADEGWKPQSEEHLQIVDVLGAHTGVVALTKTDLVDAGTIASRTEEVRDRLAGTSLAEAPVVACSSVTRAGVDAVERAVDDALAAAPPPETDGRPRLFVDRVFTIRGAGTVVTGTLTGGPLQLEQQVELYPSGTRARIRGLQSHERAIRRAVPVSRVAVNLVGVSRDDVARGDVLGLPGQWRATSVVEGTLRAVRGLEHRLTGRGAYKAYLGTTERDARVRFLGCTGVRAGEEALVRVRLSGPVVADVGERFVVRESGRRITVAGGTILDPDPPARPGDAATRLSTRRGVARPDLPGVVVAERGAVRASDLGPVTGVSPASVAGAVRVGPWWIEEAAVARLVTAVSEVMSRHHAESPLSPGLSVDALRRALPGTLAELRAPIEQSFGELLEHLAREGVVQREGTTVRMAGHRVTLGPREDDARRIEEALGAGWPTPPTATELGAERELLRAMVATGRLVQVSPDVYLLPEQYARAELAAHELASRDDGMTASAFREALGTTRKYAIPLLEHFDARGLTRREGDIRRLRRFTADSN